MRVFGHYVLPSRVKLFVAEQAAAGVLFLAAVASGRLNGPQAILVAAACVAALQGALYLADLYGTGQLVPSQRWLVAAGLGSLAATVAWAAFGDGRGGLFFSALGLALVVVLLLRGLALHRPQKALVYGSGEMARVLARAMRGASAEAVLAGFVPDGQNDDGLPSPLPLFLDRSGPIDEIARKTKADLLIIATEGPLPEEALARARAAGVEVLSAAGFCARFLRRVPPELLGKAEIVYGEGFFAPRWFDFVQRVIDLAAATVLLVLASPVLLLAMLAVKLDSPGPIFYGQERVGRGGKVYRVVKLRSMRTDAEAAGAPVWAKANDNRVTRVGKFLRKTRIDELPQLFAVFKGDMSLVGPRPERPFFVEQLKQQLPLYGLREAVKPGVTGWAQICYPYGATVEDARAKLEYDLYFIRHRSPFLVFSVIFHTVRTVLTGKGAR